MSRSLLLCLILAVVSIVPAFLCSAGTAHALPSGVCIDLKDGWRYRYEGPRELDIGNRRGEWVRIRLNCRVYNGARISFEDDYLCKHFRVYINDDPCSVVVIRRLR